MSVSALVCLLSVISVLIRPTNSADCYVPNNTKQECELEVPRGTDVECLSDYAHGVLVTSRWKDKDDCDKYMFGKVQGKADAFQGGKVKVLPVSQAQSDFEDMLLDYNYDAAVEEAREERAVGRLQKEKKAIAALRMARSRSGGRRKVDRYQ